MFYLVKLFIDQIDTSIRKIQLIRITLYFVNFIDEPVIIRNYYIINEYAEENKDTNEMRSMPFPLFHCRISLPEMKICGSWNVLSTFQSIPVQERYVKLKPSVFPAQHDRTLDRVEARSAWFTELQSYWTLPISENSTVTALAVANGRKGDGTDDRIHVLTSNPLSIFSMTPESEQIRETSLQGLISPVRGKMPFYNVASDNNGDVLVHEETVSSILIKKTPSPRDSIHLIVSRAILYLW